jgi:polyisoprenoid-binding protein YceI
LRPFCFGPQLQPGTRDIPLFEVTPIHGSIKFSVKASVKIAGKFDRLDSTLTFQSPEISTGVLEIKIQADSMDTGSGMKNGKLKSKDCFDVKNNPSITFKSSKITPISPKHFEMDGDLTIRRVSNPEKLTSDR